MVFKAERTIDIPNKDLLSWTFDENKWEQDEPRYIDAKDPKRSISLKQARSIIRKLVAGFHAAGLKKGDCPFIDIRQIYYPMMFLGIIAAGGIFAGTNPSYTEFELVHHIKTAKAKFLITEPEMLDNVLAAAKTSGVPLSNLWIFDNMGQSIPSGFKSFKDLMNHGEKDWVRFDDEKTSKETTAARLFSSGTTGLPKAVILSHYNLVAQHTMVYEAQQKPWRMRTLLCLPMFHAACVPLAHTSILKGGLVGVVMRRFELEPALQSIEKFEINEGLFVPPIFVGIVMSGLGKKAWGMTETCCIASIFHYPEDDVTGSVGRIVPNMDAKLIDDDGHEITGYGVRGEMCVRGPTVTCGYFENEKANAEAFDSEGFFKTGDIMYCDEKTQKWYVVDRKKELIKVRGFQVAPPELEGVLLSHPLIVDAAVIGVKDPIERDVEHPRAYVVKRPVPESQSLDEKTVKDHCGSRLAKFKELTGGVHFVESIPKNASGKILKRILREAAEKEAKEARAKL
ncbi:Acyl-ligase azaF [Hyphodiscus hymeniophilus]|uniref:Acyl-ligase azaF n=1 Tax=Hyphodiscus hymeniophilus TaxID=353542 RepID=A0A9P6VNX0_9HELO|nr:Acyl-ligase azaF [Hyphodiscus hymeniophilus]